MVCLAAGHQKINFGLPVMILLPILSIRLLLSEIENQQFNSLINSSTPSEAPF